MRWVSATKRIFCNYKRNKKGTIFIFRKGFTPLSAFLPSFDKLFSLVPIGLSFIRDGYSTWILKHLHTEVKVQLLLSEDVCVSLCFGVCVASCISCCFFCCVVPFALRLHVVIINTPPHAPEANTGVFPATPFHQLCTVWEHTSIYLLLC